MNTFDKAVASYLRELPKELVRRWGNQKTHSVEQVTTAAEAIGVRTEFIAYAHAAFCSQADFDAQYPAPPAGASYAELRAIIKERYVRDPGLDAAVMMMMMG